MRINNKQKMFDNKQRFSLRKLTVGLSSVLLGLTFMTVANTNHVQAAEQSGTTQDTSTQTATDPNSHGTQSLDKSKGTNTDSVIKPVDSNSGISNTRAQLTSQETPVNKNSLSTVANSESKEAANATPATVPTGSNTKTDNSLNKVGEVQSQNITEVKVRSKRAITPTPETQDVINWDAVQYQKQADGNVNITGWDINKGGVDILLPNTWDFTQKGIISDGKQAEITSDVMGNIAETSNTKAKAEHKTYNVKISENGNGKLIAEDQNWSKVFSNVALRNNKTVDRGTKLESANLNNLDISHVTNLSNMFCDAVNLQRLDVSKWDTSNVTDMSFMFIGANSLPDLDVSKWDTSNVTNMTYMFSDTSNLQSLDISNWDTHNVTEMIDIFHGMRSLKNLDVSNWDTQNVTDMSYMFDGASSLRSLDVSNWDTHNVTNMSHMFDGANSLQSLDVSKWDTHNVTNMSNMFSGTSSLQSLDVSKWDTRNVTNMSSMFLAADKLQNLDISNWNTHNVTNMSSMFDYASSLKSLDVSNWDTHNVTNMSSMFEGTSSLQNLDVSKWDTHNVTKMSSMFEGASSLQNLDVSNWNTHNVTDMFGMFDKASSLQSLDVSNWDTHSVVNMWDMFSGTGSVNGLVITANNYQGTPVPGNDDTKKLAIISNVKDHFTNVGTWGNRPKTLTVMVHDESTNTDHEEKVELDTIAYDSPEALRNAIKEKLTALKNSKTDIIHIVSDPILMSNPTNLAQELNATYKMNVKLSQKTLTVKVKYVDADENDKLVTEKDLTGKLGDQVAIPAPPENYTIDHSSSNVLRVDEEHVLAPDNNPYIIKLHHKKTTNSENKIITRKVTITDPHSGDIQHNESISYTRTANIDTVTGEVTYNPWTPVDSTKNSFSKVDVPSIAGYTPHIDGGTTADLDAKTPSNDEITNWTNKTIKVTYTADNNEITYKFVDDDNKGSQVGDIISVNGATDTKLTADQLPAGLKTVPEHYVLAEGQSLPTEIDFKANNGQMPRVIHLKHATKDIDKDHIPSGAHDKDNHPVTDKDFAKDITRTITINKPSGNVTINPDGTQHVVSTPEDKSQTITLTRQGSYDEVTGVVTWKAWEAGHFDAVAVPMFSGYKPSQSTIDAVENVGANYIDPKINVTYTANVAHQRIHYVDENGNDVKDVTVTGVTDETVNVPVPKGWNLVDSSDSTTKLANPDKDGNVAEKTIKIKRVAGVEDKGKDNDTYPVTSSGNYDNTPSAPVVDNTPNINGTLRQTPAQKQIDNTEKAPVKKNVKKHAKKPVKKIAKATKNAPSVAIAPVVPAEKQAPVSNGKANEVVSTTATVKVPDTEISEKTLPQTGSKDDASLIALGVAMIALPGFVGLLGSKKKRDED